MSGSDEQTVAGDGGLATVVAELTARVQALEDQLSLYQAVATYGPAVDSLSTEVAAGLWSDEGTYDVGAAPVGPMNGRRDIIAMLEGDIHASLVAQGCAHLMTLPLVRVEEDRAVGLGYHRLYVRDDEADGFRLWRLTASRWDWVRSGSGWEVVRRTHRLLDGSEEARTLLRDTLAEIRAPGRP